MPGIPCGPGAPAGPWGPCSPGTPFNAYCATGVVATGCLGKVEPLTLTCRYIWVPVKPPGNARLMLKTPSTTG